MNLYKYIDHLDVNNCEIMYDLLGESLRPLGDIIVNVIKMDLNDDQLKHSLYLDGVNIPRKLALLKYILTYHSNNYRYIYTVRDCYVYIVLIIVNRGLNSIDNNYIEHVLTNIIRYDASQYLVDKLLEYLPSNCESSLYGYSNKIVKLKLPSYYISLFSEDI